MGTEIVKTVLFMETEMVKIVSFDSPPQVLNSVMHGKTLNKVMSKSKFFVTVTTAQMMERYV